MRTGLGDVGAARWRAALVAMGAGLLMAAPILWVTGLSRVIGVYALPSGFVIGVIGLLLPKAGPRTRLWLIILVISFLALAAIFGGFLWFYSKVLTPDRGASIGLDGLWGITPVETLSPAL